MGLPRSTFYDAPAVPVGDVELVTKIVVICDEFKTYGYRWVRRVAPPGFCRQRQEDPPAHARGRPATQTPPTVRHHDQPRSRESDFFRSRSDQKTDGPNQLWVADITYIAIETGFEYPVARDAPAAKWRKQAP
jgi:putative transposase